LGRTASTPLSLEFSGKKGYEPPLQDHYAKLNYLTDETTLVSRHRSVSTTNLCHYYLQGYCARGNQCKFLHGVSKTAINVGPSMARPGLFSDFSCTDMDRKRSPSYPIATATVPKLSPASMTARASSKKTALDAQLFNGASVHDFIGDIYNLSKDQQGCRFLQKKLDECIPNVANIIFDEIYANFVELMMGTL
jgi:hypothetical protein